MASREELPADFAAALDRNPAAGDRFAALPPEQQADWLSWVEQGRGGAQGRSARIDEAIRRLSPGAAAAEEEIIEEPAGPPPERNWWIWLLLLLALVIAGLLLWYFLSRGDDKATVPNVIGLGSEAAATRIHDENLEVLPRTAQSKRPPNVVFAQAPGAGTQLDEGQTVTISISSGRVTVPDVTDQPVAGAQDQLTKAGFKSEVKRVASSRPKDTVVTQAPAAGVTAAHGTTVNLTVSSGVVPVVVPRLIGQTQGAAVSTLTGLKLKSELHNVASSQPSGLVVGQNPPAGKEVDRGSTVILNISTGSGGGSTTTTTTTTVTTTASANKVDVPDVRGLAAAVGLPRLNRAELKPAMHYVSATERAGRILSQSPSSGSAARGSAVRVNVSTGPSPAAAESVPNVVGDERAAAATALREAGFRVLVLNRRTSDGSQNGRVIGQTPGAGTSIPRGLLVAILVGRGTS
jgi:beta-lactam-binding protein with PASTA domain